jgi:hypothetical protein
MSALGYREENEEETTPALSKRIFFIASLALLAFFLLLDILSWLTERGGIFSIVSALVSIHLNRPGIDIDKSGLWLPFTIVSWLIVLGFCRLFAVELDISTRGKALLPALAIVGGGFALDAAFGESVITDYMASHQYSRCVAGDWGQGSGKSHVWFANYVLKPEDCREHENPKRQ